MAAGLGFKDFATGEVLTAADVDGYLMQGIWVFASNAARDAAVTAPAEGNFAFTKDTNSLWYYDGAAWVASGGSGGGLVYITSSTFSAATAVNINNCFTSSYRNYKIIVDLTTSSADDGLRFRLRVSGADNTTSNYSFAGGFYAYTGTALGYEKANATTSWQVTSTTNGTNTFTSLDLITPEIAEPTMFAALGSDPSNGRQYMGFFNAATQFDGFSIYGGSSPTTTITGQVRVYAYANS